MRTIKPAHLTLAGEAERPLWTLYARQASGWAARAKDVALKNLIVALYISHDAEITYARPLLQRCKKRLK